MISRSRLSRLEKMAGVDPKAVEPPISRVQLDLFARLSSRGLDVLAEAFRWGQSDDSGYPGEEGSIGALLELCGRVVETLEGVIGSRQIDRLRPADAILRALRALDGEEREELEDAIRQALLTLRRDTNAQDPAATSALEYVTDVLATARSLE